MKKFLALAAILAVSSANAEELKFGDLNYFLKAGQVNAGTDLIVNNEATRVDKGTETEVDSYILNTHFAYAFTDSLNLTLGINALIDGETQTDQAGSHGFDAMGIQNPLIGANVRLLQQDTAGFNFDLGLVAAIKLGEREVAGPDKDGNMIDPLFSNYAEPRSGLELNARLGKKWNEANEFYLTGGVNYHHDGEYQELQGEQIEMDSSLDFMLGGFYQYRPVNEFMMTFGLTGKHVGETDIDEGPSEYTYNNHLDFKFIFSAKYLITESFIAKFDFSQDRKGNYDIEENAGDTKVDRRNGIQYGMGVDFLF